MNLTRLLLSCGAIAAALLDAGAAQTSPAATPDSGGRPPPRYTIEQFLDTTRVTGSSFSADETRVLFSSNATGIFNAYTVPITGGTPTPLTRSTTDSTFAIGYFPRDDRILFTRDQGGNELTQIFVREPDGTERNLTPGAKVKAGFLGWSHDLRSFYFQSNARDPRFFDVYAVDLATLTPERVFENQQGLQYAARSRDNRYLAFNKPNLRSDSDIYLFDAQTGELKHLTPHTGEILHSAETFDPSGKFLLFLTDEGSEFQYLMQMELASGRRTRVHEERWDITDVRFSHSGRYRLISVNADGRTVVRMTDTRSGQPVKLPEIPGADITGINVSRSDQWLAFSVNGDRIPSDLHVYRLAEGKLTRLTRSLNPQIDPGHLVDSRVIRYRSFDGMEIPAMLYRPHGATAQHRRPALVEVHGGPGGQSRSGYTALYQFLANHGHVILRVNNRGSIGYGKSFFAADDRRHGREPLWDCIDAKKYLQSLEYVDPNRIGIIGGSYGGYMVLAALAFHPEAFNAGVNIFGVSNWVRTLKSIPPWWESQRLSLYRELGDPATDEENLRAISPLFHAEKIVRPLLVLQGANDPRVIQAESDDIVAAVKKNGVPVEYLVFPDEGHGFTKKANEARAYQAILEFLNRQFAG